MKKIFAAVTALALALAIGGTALAQCRKDGGCGDCNQGAQLNQAAPGGTGAADSDPTRQFMRNTLDLRQEMMNKRFELQRENLKGTPDANRIAALKADVSVIQSRINEIRVQSGLPETGKRDGECFKPDGGCNKPGGDCNGKPCWQK
ncbi:MAG: hypothetical protein JJE30_09930 [Desulfuromonadales bacterium]|nr:hypothetical protein [Desulfuromonadales bacterium]